MLKLPLQLIPIGAAGCILGCSVPYGWKVCLAISSMWDVGVCGGMREAAQHFLVPITSILEMAPNPGRASFCVATSVKSLLASPISTI